MVTLGFAVVGGVITGLIMHQVDLLVGLVVVVADVSVIGVVGGMIIGLIVMNQVDHDCGHGTH